MRNFQDTFETRKRSFISAFSIFMTVPLRRANNFMVNSSKRSFIVEIDSKKVLNR